MKGMGIITDLQRLENETEEQYLWRIGQLVDSGKVENWKSINNIVNQQLNIEEDSFRDESSFRKKYQAAKKFYDEVFSKREPDEYQKELQIQKRELERAKIQFRDERNAWQKMNFIDGRVEEKLNKLEEEIKSQGKIDYVVDKSTKINSDNDLLIILSDLHIGQCFSSAFGKYDSEIAKDRMNQYLNEILNIQATHNSENAYVSLQGDLISNSIHKALAITNRENVIEQIKLASEMVASFVYELSKKFNNVYMASVTGNHSRIDRKDDALHDERLDSLIDWYVKAKLEHIENVIIIDEKIDSSISLMEIRGLKYIGVHGDFDGFSKSGVANLVLMLGYKPYAISYGHLHTCAVDETAGVKMIRGGSLAGSGDDYTVEKRLSGKPSQMVCVCTDKGIKAYYTVELN